MGIPTDWLTADWHEKGRPKKPRRRQSRLPESYRRLPKREKQQVRAAAKWIRQRVSLVNWGRKLPDDKAGKPVPKPINLKEPVREYLEGVPGKWIRKLPLGAIIRHLLDEDTFYFTGNPTGGESILMLDIDCHASGTLEGATQFAEFLKQRFFPDLYYEVSTHGRGIQGFVVVDMRNFSCAEFRAHAGEVEKWLKRVLHSTSFDVEDVELKGLPMVVKWGPDYRRQVADLTFGSLAKMPRDWKKFDAWRWTTNMMAHEFVQLPVNFPIPDKTLDHKPPVVRVVKGSVCGKMVDPDHVRLLEPLAKWLLDLKSPEVKGGSRAVVVIEDVQVSLAIIRSCTLRPNPDESMPLARIKGLWDAMYLAGDVTRAFSFNRFAAIRNMLTGLGLIEWTDAGYRFGKACKWRASAKLMQMMDSLIQRTTPSLSSSVVYNIVEEAKAERPDQLGLRPKMVSPSDLRIDWNEKFREAGLEHLAA